MTVDRQTDQPTNQPTNNQPTVQQTDRRGHNAVAPPAINKLGVSVQKCMHTRQLCIH